MAGVIGGFERHREGLCMWTPVACPMSDADTTRGVCVQNGDTALLYACWSGHLEVAQWLVSSAGSSAVTERNMVSVIFG